MEIIYAKIKKRLSVAILEYIRNSTLYRQYADDSPNGPLSNRFDKLNFEKSIIIAYVIMIIMRIIF